MKTNFPSILIALATLIAGGSHAATRTWTGLGFNPFWANSANWAGGIRPAASDDVVFPASAPVVATVNNWIGVVHSITFDGAGYSISGNSLVLTNGINATNTSGVNAVAVPVILGANQSFTNLNAGAELVLVSLDFNGHSVSFRGAGTNLIANVLLDSTGGGSLTNAGTGVFLLAGTNSSFTGQTVLNAGTNLINSFHRRSPISWTAGTLGGAGVLGQVLASGATAKRLTPGFAGTGILTTSNLVLNSSVTSVMRINGLNPGTEYDQLVVSNGNLILGAATLSLSFLSSLAPSFGNTVTLIKLVNSASTISGTFANLPEGSTFTNNGSIYRLSYVGGDGNDVTLTVSAFLSTGALHTWGGSGTNSLWMNRSNWTERTIPAQGDALLFPTTAQRTTNFNDFPAETTFDSLFFVAPASAVLKDNISGNAIRLNNGVKVAPSAPASLNASGTVVISNRLNLNFSQTFTNVVDTDVHFAGDVDLGLNTLSVGVRAGLPDIFFDGSIVGAGQFETTGDGTVTLNASNAITGNIFVNRGILVVQHPRALGRVTDGPVQVGANGTLRLQASNAIFTGSSILLTGRLEAVSTGSTLNPGILVAGSNALITNFSGLTLIGSISNGSQLTLSGSGISRLSPKGFIAGSGLLKNSGHLQADGFIQNVVQLGIGALSGTLSGTGNVNTVVCTNTFGIIAPGSPTDPTNAVDALTIRSLILSSGATLQMDLLRNKVSDLIITSNAPTLGNATLTLKALTNLAPAQRFTLIGNASAAPVTNTFANLPEGAFLGAANGNFGLQISYVGGNGNDVVVTVQSNTPPVLTLVSRFVNEQNLLTFSNSSVDFDQPPQPLTWALLSAPAGVNLNPTSGVVTWTPTEAQGPSTNAIVLRVTDSGVPPLSSTGAVTVTVGEVNQPPVPVPVSLTNVILGSTLTLQLAATDPDIPANALTWGPAPPATGFVDAILSTNGLFTFTPTTNFPGTRIFAMSVRDFNPDASFQKSLTNTLAFSVRIDLLRVVTNTNDSGPGSLRQAILDINNAGGGGRIEFNIPGTGPFKIFLITALSPLLRDTVIDGYTQPGSHPNTLTNGNDALPLLELSGENITTPTNGLSWSGPRVTVRGLVLNRWDTAIAAGRAGSSGSTSNAVVEGCFIGTDPTGTQRRTNRLGVSFLGTIGGRIGGPAVAQRNLISASSQAGVALFADTSTSLLHNLVIQNNFIGTDRSGTNALGNGTFGLFSQTTILSSNSLVADNIISANGQGGLQLAGARNSVVRNKIGLGVDGAAPLGNGGSGIEIFGNRNLVGGGNGADANRIAGNNGPGIHVSAGTNHAILGNSTFRNSGLGIDLGNLGPEANDLGDLDGGPNNLQNTPVLATNIVADSTTVTVNGSLGSAVLSSYHLEFFHSPDFAPSNQPQAKTFLGSLEVATDGNGNAGFSAQVTIPSLTGFITATATDANGNTSELSPPAGIENADFYAGVPPNLSIVSGNNQTNFANLFLPEPLVMLVTGTNGAPLSNAPITFAVIQGSASLADSFTASRSSLLAVRTSSNGLVQVFVHLGSEVSATTLISAAAFTSGGSTSVTFLATSTPRPAEGVQVPGDSASPAVDSLVNMLPIGVPGNEIQDGIIMTRLDLRLAPGATVGQVNAALNQVQAGIVTMLPRFPAMTIAVPPQPDADSLLNLAAVINSSPGILRASLAYVDVPNMLPPPPAGDATGLTQLHHLLPARFPAAWNAASQATNGCPGFELPVVVADKFEGLLFLTGPYATFDDEIPNFSRVQFLPPANETHGFDVTTTLGALFDATNPTGANPFSRCLNILLLQRAGLSGVQAITRVFSTLPSGKFLLNWSMGYNASCLNPTNCNPRLPLDRALDAADWKALTRNRWQDFLVCPAAGNERTNVGSLIYPGLGMAPFESLVTVAAQTDPFFGFIRDTSFWNAQPGYAGFSNLTATATDSQVLATYVQSLGMDTVGAADNVLIAGSTTAGRTFPDLRESAFSNSGADVYAVGENIFMLSGPASGTSFSAPQVAGLASYLWLLSEDLRNRPARITRQAILANSRPVQQAVGSLNVIDAYATVLSLDQAVLPRARSDAPVRFAILDINNDLKFDEADLQLHLANGVTNVSNGSTRDYGRSDLNGDGFTGGPGTEKFDLDRIGSTQFGQTVYDSIVPQQIEGHTVIFNENALTDREILCYYANSSLYTGDTNARALLLADACQPAISVSVFPGSATLLAGQTTQFVAIVSGTSDQHVIWSLPNGSGTIDANGLFTAACPTNLDSGVTVTVRATSVSFPNKFGEAFVSLPTPFQLLEYTEFLGTCDVRFPGPWSVSFPRMRFGPGQGCGSSFFDAELTSACGNNLFVIAMDVFPHTDTSTNEPHRAGLELKPRYTALYPTTVTVSLGTDWTTSVLGSGHGDGKVSALLNDPVGHSITNALAVFEINGGFTLRNNPLPPFQIPKGTVLEMTLDAVCLGSCSGGGRAVTVTFTPSGPTGLFKLSPAVETVAPLELLTYAFSWTVPDPFNWHHLRDLQFRIRDENNVVLWLRFNETDRTFSLLNEATGRFGQAATVASNRWLETPSATLHLAQTSVVAAGPTSPTVTLNLALSFKPSAAGRTYIVEVAASDDDGNTDDFIQAGVLTIGR